MLTADDVLALVKAVEQKLKIKSSEDIDDTFTNDELQTAAESFIYLSTCPKDDMRAWFMFYNNLFMTKSADQIILTLNRMMKTKTSQDNDAKVRSEKLLKMSLSISE